jgi:hypothetical protein
MLLMALEGRFGDVPDCAVFADTQWEPKAVYEWLERLIKEVAPFPVHIVTAGDIRKECDHGGPWARRDGRPFVTMPVYSVDGLSWAKGQGRRQCSKEYKIEPLRRWIRERVRSAEVWIGISTDESARMKPSRVGYLTNRWPLIEQGLSREECQEYLVSRIGPAPKSSCIGCPFKGDGDWARLRAQSPEEFDDAVRFDAALRSVDPKVQQYLHRSLVPLGDIKEFNHENQGRMFLDGFGNECEGICGV